MPRISSRIKLRHLQAFLEVARRESFARAAERLSVSQPAMSKTIRELEEEVGTPLFERGRRGVTLTTAGLTLLRHAGPALKTLQEGLATVSQSTTQTAMVRVGALSTVEGGILPAAAARLHAEAPEIRLHVRTGTSAYLLSQLGLGDLDLVIGRMSEARETRGLSYEHLYYEPLVLIARPLHPLAELTSLDADVLREYPWVVPPAPTTLREQLERFWVEHGGPPPIALETLSLPLSQHYVQKTSALWVAPMDAVKPDLDAGRLVRLPVALEVQGGSVGLCINASQGLSAAADRLCAQLRVLSSDAE